MSLVSVGCYTPPNEGLLQLIALCILAVCSCYTPPNEGLLQRIPFECEICVVVIPFQTKGFYNFFEK